MQGEEIGPRQDLVEGQALDPQLPEALGRDERVVRNDAHLQAEGTPRHLPADPAEPEHAEHLVRKLDTAPLRPLPSPRDEGCMGLRDVARQRDEQADRVLCRRDDVRLRRIRDDDATPGRRVHVDVVDPDPGPTDHLQAGRGGDHLGGHRRGGADDQRVVVPDQLLERGFRVDIDFEPLAEQLDAGIRDLLPNEDSGSHAATGDSNAANAFATATPRSMSAPSSVKDNSSAASALAMSKTSNQPIWPILKIFPFS